MAASIEDVLIEVHPSDGKLGMCNPIVITIMLFLVDELAEKEVREKEKTEERGQRRKRQRGEWRQYKGEL
uniref:Uncharacterized protein n=1 Tax=Amphimedon queenslandica TaxID=400682 RepID=A0A1X7VJ23_AMPQE